MEEECVTKQPLPKKILPEGFMVTTLTYKKSSNKGRTFLRKLPLLDFTTTLYPDIDLQDVYIICAQHLVSTTYSLFHTLLKLGLKPSNLSAIGKCYSTDPQAYEEMKKIGIDVCSSSMEFDSHRPFDDQYRENIKIFIKQRLKKLTGKGFKKIIILDDGGELISAANSILELTENVIGVEQTSSGFRKLKNKKLKFPIINVARSPAKLNYESPIIAKLVVDTLVRRIEKFQLKPREVLIIGNGPIGSQIHEVLKNDYQVSIFDEDSSKSSLSPEEFEKSLRKFDLIIGCTGKTVLGPNQYKLLKKNVILVSASSSDREFDAINLRNKLPLVTNCHENLLSSGIYLVNCGFPINFAAEYREIDTDELQLTRSLLLASILQAYSHFGLSKRRFIPLDVENQREILQRYFTIFAPKKFEGTEQLAI